MLLLLLLLLTKQMKQLHHSQQLRHQQIAQGEAVREMLLAQVHLQSSECLGSFLEHHNGMR